MRLYPSSEGVVAELIDNVLMIDTSSEAGTVKVKAVGYKGITSNEVTITVLDKVLPDPTSISIDVTGGTSMYLGDVRTFTVTYEPSECKEGVTWESDKTTVATVDAETGEVTAISLGKFNLTAKAVNGDATDTVEITVTPYSIAYAREHTDAKGLTICGKVVAKADVGILIYDGTGLLYVYAKIIITNI